MNIIPVILSGGSGTRLCLLSRKQYPKQYLTLVGENTMLQETILRLEGIFVLWGKLIDLDDIFVNKDFLKNNTLLNTV